MMKYVVIVLSSIQGLWMLIDGVFVLVNGRYIGPEKPGPWASVVGATGVDVFKLGPIFVLYGVAWLIFVAALLMDATWARTLGIVLSILTLWYLPFGTVISVIVLLVLVFVLKN
jgi:hypothetical protein